jgi:hypothetical protein
VAIRHPPAQGRPGGREGEEGTPRRGARARKGRLISGVLSGSFRDPSGFVFTRDGELYRQVSDDFAAQYDLLLASGLRDALVEPGLLVRHEEADLSLAPAPGAYRVLKPERVPFVSYPYEWCFGQLKDAALATLAAQKLAMDHGMSLRDASAYNVQFLRGRAVLIDTLSFERLREGEPWVAYRQFCQHFLAPLALMSYRDVRLGQLLRVHLDGIPLDLAAELLPRKARSRPSLAMHIVAHARSQRRHQADAEAPSSRRRFGMQAFRGLVDNLESAVEKLYWEPGQSPWAGYYSEAESYSEQAMAHKRELVGSFIDMARPAAVWDLGANTGEFGRIATGRGIPTVCFDVDPASVELNWRRVRTDGVATLLPLLMDLTNPSPRIGWENAERQSLADRGPVDTVFALALVHHLAIGNNVPLPRLASFLRSTCRTLIVEFVPKEDPKTQVLLATREDVFPDYTREGFEHAFEERFSIERREPVMDSARVLYLMRGR